MNEIDQQKFLKKLRWKFYLMSKFMIPMIGYTGVKILSIDDTSCSSHIRLKRKTRNHLKSMYFGALSIGADVAGGLHAFYFAEKHNCDVSFAFKAVSGEFIKRAESDCTFISKEGKKVENAVLESLKTGERINEQVHIDVYDLENELVATFEMTLSVKCKPKKA